MFNIYITINQDIKITKTDLPTQKKILLILLDITHTIGMDRKIRLPLK